MKDSVYFIKMVNIHTHLVKVRDGVRFRPHHLINTVVAMYSSETTLRGKSPLINYTCPNKRLVHASIAYMAGAVVNNASIHLCSRSLLDSPS